MSTILTLAGGTTVFFSYIAIRIRFLMWRTEKVIKKHFKTTELFTEARYTSPLLVIAGDKVCILRPLHYWQLHKTVQLLLIGSKLISVDDLIKNDSFYPALAYILAREGEDIVQLAKFLQKTITYSQIIRIIQVISIQNNLSVVKRIYKEITNG